MGIDEDGTRARSDSTEPPRRVTRTLVGYVVADRYRIERLVSAGAYTVVVDATDLQLDRLVTLKLIRPEISELAEFRRRFDQVMRSMSTLSHLNIAAVTDWGEDRIGGRTASFAVIEHLGAGSLRDLFDRGRYLTPSQALVVGLDACRALDHAHRRNLVHGELTPSKLVFGDDRRLRVIDLGLARLLGASAWKEPVTVAPHVARYASPEQALGQPIDAKTDVYALALTLIEGVTGSVPFAADSTVATLSARVGKLTSVSADLGTLASVLERAARPDRNDRWTSAEFGRALIRAAENLPRPAPLPLVTSTLFRREPTRRPTDPTGGVDRPAEAPPVGVTTTADESPTVGESPAVAETAASDEISDVVESAPAEGAEAATTTSTAATDAAFAAGTADRPAAATPQGVAPIPVEQVRVEPLQLAPDALDDPADDMAAAEAAIDAMFADDVESADDADRPDQVADDADRTGDAANDDDVGVEGAAEAVVGTVDTVGTSAWPSPTVGAATLVAPAPAPVPPSTDDQAAATEVTTTTSLQTLPAEQTASFETLSSSPPDADSNGESRRWWLRVLVGLFLVAALAGVGVVAYLALRTERHEVPDLAGLSEDRAAAAVADFDWEVQTRRERSDEFPDERQVIRTSPSAGEQLAEGEPFILVISEGPEFRQLPELSGLTVGDARRRLQRLQLTSSNAPRAYHERIEPGSVVSWSVDGDESKIAGDDVLPETEILLTLSRGPEPRSIPALRTLSVAQARSQLDELRLRLKLAKPIFSDVIEKDLIISQRPKPDSEIERGGSVTVVVSKGQDLVVFPDIEGLSFRAAVRRLEESGFTRGEVLGNTRGTFEEATIGGVSADPGEEFPRGAAVDLVYL